MSEAKAETLFKSYRQQIIKHFGTKPLYDDQIDKFAKKTKIKNWQGVYPYDQLPDRSGSYVVNTGNHKSPGIHWVAIVRTPSTDYIYDSFARPKNTILKHLRGTGRRELMSDRKDSEQLDQYESQRNICGHLSLAWLLVYSELGIRSAMLI